MHPFAYPPQMLLDSLQAYWAKEEMHTLLPIQAPKTGLKVYKPPSRFATQSNILCCLRLGSWGMPMHLCTFAFKPIAAQTHAHEALTPSRVHSTHESHPFCTKRVPNDKAGPRIPKAQAKKKREGMELEIQTSLTPSPPPPPFQMVSTHGLFLCPGQTDVRPPEAVLLDAPRVLSHSSSFPAK
eukprot:1158563-Pelagomonas_calceolata.AAC.4